MSDPNAPASVAPRSAALRMPERAASASGAKQAR